MSALIKAVKDHALKNYNKGGWDVVVECWSDEEIARVIKGSKTNAGAIAKMSRFIRPSADYRRDIQGA